MPMDSSSVSFSRAEVTSTLCSPFVWNSWWRWWVRLQWVLWSHREHCEVVVCIVRSWWVKWSGVEWWRWGVRLQWVLWSGGEIMMSEVVRSCMRSWMIGNFTCGKSQIYEVIDSCVKPPWASYMHLGNSVCNGVTLQQNYMRVVEVWMDEEHKEYYYTREPMGRGAPIGDISKQLQFKKDHNCKSFKWFMDNVAYEVYDKFPKLPPNKAWGEVSGTSLWFLSSVQFKLKVSSQHLASSLYTLPCLSDVSPSCAWGITSVCVVELRLFPPSEDGVLAVSSVFSCFFPYCVVSMWQRL